MLKNNLPPDPTPEEVKIVATAHALIYSKLKDPVDKFIVAYVFDMGYPRQDCAIALGVHYKTVWARIKKIKQTLGTAYIKDDYDESKETGDDLLE